MRIRCHLVAAALAGALACAQGAAAQTFRPLQLPDDFYQRAAQRDRPPLPAGERERIVGRASGDFSGASYYNRPGGTWDDYLRDWYNCEAVTNGSRIPSGLVNYVKSPSLLSPRETGVGVTIGGAIGTGDNLYAVQEANRRACIQVRGWRRVTPNAAESQRIGALSDAAFLDWVKGAIGNQNPAGTVESNAYARLPDNPAIAPDAPPPGEPSLRISGGQDPRAPLVLSPAKARSCWLSAVRTKAVPGSTRRSCCAVTILRARISPRCPSARRTMDATRCRSRASVANGDTSCRSCGSRRAIT